MIHTIYDTYNTKDEKIKIVNDRILGKNLPKSDKICTSKIK